MEIGKIYKEFVRLLRKRFDKDTYTTEDSIRYTFFHAFCSQGQVEPHRVILERPYVEGGRDVLDAFIRGFDRRDWAFEFKYHRKAPKVHKGIPRTQHAGALFNDIARLSAFKEEEEEGVERLLVHVTDSVMAKYFRNEKNGFGAFMDLAPDDKFLVDDAFIKSKPKIFQKGVKSRCCCSVVCAHSADLPEERLLRVFRVVPASPSK